MHDNIYTVDTFVADLRAIAHPVLRHRIITTFNAESNGITSDVVTDKLIEAVSERHDDDKVAPDSNRHP